MNNIKTIFQFNEINENFRANLGEKAISIGRLFNLSIPTPPGFVVSADSYRFFLNMSNLDELIKSKFYTIDKNDEIALKNVSSEIEDLIMKTIIPPYVEKDISRTYSKLSGFSDTYVSVRASYIFDGKDANVNQTTFLNIRGVSELILAIKACWASLYEYENIKYRIDNEIDITDCSSAVIIQKMVQAEASGITFTYSPLTEDNTEISIQATLGVIDIIKNGEIKPDSYHIDKETLKFKEKSISRQEYMFIRNTKGKSVKDTNIKTKVALKWQEKQKIDDKTLIMISRYARGIEDQTQFLQEIEWIVEKGKIWIIKSDSIKNIEKQIESKEASHIEEAFAKEDKEIKKTKEINLIPETKESVPEIIPEVIKEVVPEKEEIKVIENIVPEVPQVETPPVLNTNTSARKNNTNLLITGIPIFPGIIEGEISVLKNINEVDHNKMYDILVIESLTEEWKEVLKNVKALVIDVGDINSRETEIVREFGIPTIISTQIGTKTLENNTYAILDGSTGRLYETKRKREEEIDISKKLFKETRKIHTATKFYTNISDINLYEDISESDFDGVYISAEDLILDLKVHPKQIFSQEKSNEYIDQIAKKLSKLCDSIGNDRHVIYTISNLTSNEMFDLQGGVQFEVQETNPHIGYRGTLRSIKEIEILNMELEIVKSVRNKYGYKNLWIMIPFIRTTEELIEMKKIILSSNLRRSSTFKIFIDIEIPSNVIMINEFLEVGIDGININYEKLAQMILSIDFQNPKLKKENINYHPAMQKAIDTILNASNSYKIVNSIYAEDIVKDSDFLKYLIRRGVNIINTTKDNLSELKAQTLNIEKDILS